MFAFLKKGGNQNPFGCTPSEITLGHQPKVKPCLPTSLTVTNPKMESLSTCWKVRYAISDNVLREDLLHWLTAMRTAFVKSTIHCTPPYV